MSWVAGIDEAGRGPLAGEVYAAAVVLDPKCPIKGLTDSKALSAVKRDALAITIREQALCYRVAWACAREIDALNILQATFLAMRRAAMGLSCKVDALLIDGNRMPQMSILGSYPEITTIIKGDLTQPAISAASILAKVARDERMLVLDQDYPEYGFAQHKGYPTALHKQRLNEYGPCPVHRYTFAPVQTVLRQRQAA